MTPSSYPRRYSSWVPQSESRREERAIYLLLAIVGSLLVMQAIAARGTPDAGATFGLGFVALAVVGLGSQVRAARRGRLLSAYARRRRRP